MNGLFQKPPLGFVIEEGTREDVKFGLFGKLGSTANDKSPFYVMSAMALSVTLLLGEELRGVLIALKMEMEDGIELLIGESGIGR